MSTPRLPAPQTAVDTLTGRPVDVGAARAGLPRRPGFYAWWIAPGSIPGVPRQPHPNLDHEFDLLYVGIAPNSATSKQSLRTRVVGNHLGGNTGSSTFRFSLASLLLDTEHLHPIMRGTKYVLSAEENHRLTDWQRRNLFLTWCIRPEPWQIEGNVIAAMLPPLNVAENSAHPFFKTMRAARGRFRDTARSSA